MRSISLILALAWLNGCAAVAIPLNLAAGDAITGNATSRAEAIQFMNCSQLKRRWAEINRPLAAANPTRLIAAEKSLVRQFSRQRGCPIG